MENSNDFYAHPDGGMSTTPPGQAAAQTTDTPPAPPKEAEQTQESQPVSDAAKLQAEADEAATVAADADYDGCRSPFRSDVDHDSELMPIMIPT